jgi:hypothetical protein
VLEQASPFQAGKAGHGRPLLHVGGPTGALNGGHGRRIGNITR